MRTFNFGFTESGYTPPSASGTYNFNLKELIYIPADPLESYYGFSFREAGYAAPTGSGSFSFGFTLGSGVCPDEWIDSEKDHWPEDPNRAWGECTDPFTYLNQIWTDDTYVYAATTDGLNIIDLDSELAYAQVSYEEGFKSVWADDNYVYLASPSSGVLYIEKTVISGAELSQHLQSYLTEPDILSNKVRYIHGNNGHMGIVSAGGLNVRGPDVYYENASGRTEAGRKCFIDSAGTFYYTTYDGSWQISIITKPYFDWTSASKFYLAPKEALDIFASDEGVLFVATLSGVRVIDTSTDQENNYFSDVTTAVWADPTATASGGKMYCLSWGTNAQLSAYDLGEQQLYDLYTQSFAGRGQETLTDDGTKDLNVNTP